MTHSRGPLAFVVDPGLPPWYDGSPCIPSSRKPGDVGYPRVNIKKKVLYEHRLVYEAAHGPIPPGMQVDHVCHGLDESCPGGNLCSHRACINPAHLQAVTNAVNVMRSRGPSAAEALMTHCIRGHEFNEENTHVTKAGRRQCRPCKRIRQNSARAKR